MTFGLESLEPRTLLYSWSAQEVYFAELVNRARANPITEGARLGIDLAIGLSAQEQALLTPTFPLALNAPLTTAARAHSADMAARNFFDHTNPSGFNPTFRASAAGYAGTAGENIGAGYDTIDAAYRFWMATPSERRNILSLYTNFDSTYHYDDLGFGTALNVPGALYTSYYTADFGNPTSDTRSPKLTGVVYADTSGDQFYSIGEGMASVRIDAFAGSTTTGTPAGTYTTDAAGYYQFALPNGSYAVLFTRLSDGYRTTKTITINGQNAKLDARAAELTNPDEHANAGQWSLATVVTINPSNAAGAAVGVINISGDTDLFSFTAPRTGATTISAISLGTTFAARLRIYNSSQTLIASGVAGSPFTSFTVTVSLTAGQTHFVLLDANGTSGTGSYGLTIQGPQPPPDDFANAGQWSQAAPITIDSDAGNGARAGQLELTGDSDLFTFIAPRTGSTMLSSLITGGGLSSRIRVYDAAHTLVATGSAGANAGDSTITAALAGGQTYFLLIDSPNASTGTYSVQVIGPAAPTPDDYADADEWTLAAAMTVNSTTGNASITGHIEAGADADLFTFIAGKSGLTTISSLIASGSLTSRIRIYDNAHALIATGTPGTNTLDSIATATLTIGERYFILIDSTDAAATGDYTVSIAAPTDTVIPPQYLDASGQPVNPVYLSGKPTLTFINQLGHPVIAIRSATGVWNLTDLQTTTNSPSGVTSLISWVEPRDGLLYAAAASPTGLLLFKLAANNTWSFRNITAEVRVSRPIVSNLATFVDNAGLRQIGGLSADGHMVSYWMTGLMWPQGWRYYYTDLASRDLTLRGRVQPTIAGNITTYVTQKNSLNYVTLSPAGSVILFFRPGGGLATQLWNTANLTVLTGAAPFVGTITATETSTRIVNISGTDASGNLWMITWRSGEGWKSRNVTAATASGGSVALTPGSATSWINTAGAGFVAGITSAGALVLYRYTFTNNQNTWTFATLSASITGAPIAAGTLRATSLSTGAILIAATTTAGEVLRYTFTPGGSGTWTAESVSDLLMP